MTFVTFRQILRDLQLESSPRLGSVGMRVGQAGNLGSRRLLLIFRFSLQGLQVSNEHVATIDLDHAFSL